MCISSCSSLHRVRHTLLIFLRISPYSSYLNMLLIFLTPYIRGASSHWRMLAVQRTLCSLFLHQLVVWIAQSMLARDIHGRNRCHVTRALLWYYTIAFRCVTISLFYLFVFIHYFISHCFVFIQYFYYDTTQYNRYILPPSSLLKSYMLS